MTAIPSESPSVKGTPTRTKYAVFAAALRKSGSWKTAMKLSRPMKFTARGSRRSRLRRSVTAIASDMSTGPAVKAVNSSTNGNAKPHAARVWRQ